MHRPTSLTGDSFLIIGGTSKAATTSVFTYLAGHPEICASTAKETRFFLDLDYPLSSSKRYERDGPEAYLSFFDCDDDGRRWRLEATPDYLYAPGAARFIRETLTVVRVVFILRGPVSRLLSWYQFGQAMNEIPPRMTFDEYVEIQKSNRGPSFPQGYRHPAFRALQDGRYSEYLKQFLDVFDRSSVHVVFQEDLGRDPRALMQTLCRWLSIDASYFDDFSFATVNKSAPVRSPRLHRSYVEAKQHLRSWLRKAPAVRRVLRPVGQHVDAAYETLNVTERTPLEMSSVTRQFIAAYYEGEAERLAKLLAVETPWGR